MTTNSATSFDQALASFKAGLKKKDCDAFNHTTKESLLQEIENLQTKQHSQRLGMNLARLRPVLGAMEELGKVVEVFSNTSNIVAFVWVCVSFLAALLDDVLILQGPDETFATGSFQDLGSGNRES
jgi:hypothetical protein